MILIAKNNIIFMFYNDIQLKEVELVDGVGKEFYKYLTDVAWIALGGENWMGFELQCFFLETFIEFSIFILYFFHFT